MINRWVKCLLCCTLIVITTVISPNIVQAASSDNDEPIDLTRGMILELAVKNDLTVQQQDLQIKLSNGELLYYDKQREELVLNSGPRPQVLPTTIEELLTFVPDFNELSEQEQQETVAMLSVQAMINASMNQILEFLAQSQDQAGFQQWFNQMEGLNNSVSGKLYDLRVANLDKQKQKLAAQLQAVTSYYELHALQIDLRAAEYEVGVLEAQLADSKHLSKFGLVTKKEIEQIEHQLSQQKVGVNRIQGAVDEKMDNFKLLLGLTKDQRIILPPLEEMRLKETINIASIKVENQYEYKKAEEALTYAIERRNDANNDSILSEYLEKVIQVETDRKKIVSSWLEQKSQALYSQKESLSFAVTEVTNKQRSTESLLTDYKQLYAAGQITEREIEVVNHELVRIQFAEEKAILNQLIWQEKMKFAQLGLLE